MDINEQLHRQHEQFRNECFQRELQQEAINAASMQNQLTNARLAEINASLQEQVLQAKEEAQEAKESAKKSSKRSWISIGISGFCALLELVSIILKVCHML